ncbi:patched family protein [Ancylostoma caninum]|uniref:Patched family protein n=1 Tax=Ancylostoma caninum TaxID=29170 RepID=A0A368GWJ8_ANCCA|nr:patched family protein [Ancylostoma caninum]
MSISSPGLAAHLNSSEARTYLEFHNLTVFPQRAFVIFAAKDGGNILRDGYIDEVLRFDKLMTTSLADRTKMSERSCHPLCELNRPFHLIMKELRSNESDADRQLGYPESTFHGTPLFIGMHFHDVRVVPETNKLEAKSIILWYFSRVDTPERKRTYKDTTLNLFRVSNDGSFSDLIDFHIFGDEIANSEMVRVTVTLITPFLATISAFGLLSWLKYPIYSMQCVTPFLVLGIGVDDAFILIHRWKHRSDIQDHSVRLTQVIVDVGPSITITSLTNIIAFGVGFFTPTPQMSLFCLATSVALLIDYIVTYTILAPVVYLCSDKKEYQPALPTKPTGNDFLGRYSRLLCSLNGRLICGVFLITVYSISAVGVYSMKSTFEPAKAFPSDSPLVKSLKKIRPIFNTYFPVNIYVNHPPNISDAEQHAGFYNMVNQLETVEGAYGRNRTMLFLDAYERFDKKVTDMTRSFFLVPDQEYKPSLHNMQFWLDKVGNPPSIRYVRDNETDEGRLTSFSFMVLGKGMAEWANRAHFVQGVRQVLAEHPRWNATLFDGDSAVLSLILTVGNDLIGSITATVACMAGICLLFVNNRIGLVGLLSWWGADLDPVTQVDVLLATGFSVDYTAHVAYQFYRCRGSAVERVASSLGEMAAPMIQAGLSTFLCMLPLIFVPTYAIVAFAKTIFIVVGIGGSYTWLIRPTCPPLALCTINTSTIAVTGQSRASHPERIQSVIAMYEL